MLFGIAMLSASAQEILVREGQNEALPGMMAVPFVFSSKSAGFSGGLSVGNRGRL